jgi:hypothetical protein
MENKLLYNKKEAYTYLGIGRRAFELEVKNSRIAFKIVGKRLMFPIWELDNWLKSTTKHIDFIKEGKRGMPTYRSTRQTGDTSVLENLYAQMFGKKPSVV